VNQARLRYTRVAIALHWLIAVLVLGQIFFGWYLGDVPRGSAARGGLVNLHKSIGLTIWLLAWIRLGWRWRHAPPPPAAGLPGWQRAAATLVHWALYACLLLAPLAGYIASNYSKYGVTVYGLWRLPPWGRDDKAMYDLFRGIHGYAAWTLAALVTLHIAAAIYHAARRDGVVARMSPLR
jgi:cytochrome b561